MSNSNNSSEVGKAHVHLDSGADAKEVGRLVRKPHGRVQDIEDFVPGPQRERLVQIYAAQTPTRLGEARFGSLATFYTDRRDNTEWLVARLLDELSGEEGLVIRAEQVMAAINYGEGVQQADSIFMPFGAEDRDRVSYSSPTSPIAVRHLVRVPSQELSSNDFLKILLQEDISVGGVSSRPGPKDSSLSLVSSHQLFEHNKRDPDRSKLIATQNKALQDALSRRHIDALVHSTAERILGVWKL